MDLKWSSWLKSWLWKKIAASDCTLIRCVCRDGDAAMRAISPRRHVQHIFRDKETSRGWEEAEGGGGGRGWIIRCLLHSAPSDTDATLSCLPCRPSAADSVIHNVRNEREWHLHPGTLFSWKNFISGGTLRDVLSTRKLFHLSFV